MTIIMKFFILILRLIYSVMKLQPVKDKIVFISRQSNDINVDFNLLINDLNDRYKKYKTIVLTKKIESGLFHKIGYCFHILRQMYHISNAKAVILDSYCIPISVLNHRKNLLIIQMWHALGSFKKFGLSIKDKKESINPKLIKLLKMHQNYNYIFASSPSNAKNFKDAFGYDIKKVLSYPLPRLDLLKDKNYKKITIQKITKEYSNIKDKKNIVYAPTFRISKNSIDRKKDSDSTYIKRLIDCIDFDKYNLIVKLHPLSNIKIDDDRVIIDNIFKTSDMLFIADYVITDYSAIVYEAAFLNKPLFFYGYDLDDYIKNRDFYLDLGKDLPGVMYKDANDVIKNIEKDNYNLDKVREFSNNNIVKCKKSYTKDINDFIIRELNK